MSDPVGDPDYDRGLRVRSSLSDPWPVEQVSLVVFTPGCLAAGQLDLGLRLVADSGFTPVQGRYFRFTEPMVRRVWRYQLPTFRPDRWRLIVDLLLAGPSFLLVCVDPDAHDPSAAARMAARKGPSDPRLGQPGQLRTELGGMNKIINLVHCAQEPADVVREAAILLEEPELRAAWSRSTPALPAATGWWPRSAPVPRWAGMSFAHTAALLRQRLVEAATARLADPGVGVSAHELLELELRILEKTSVRRPLAALAELRAHCSAHRIADLLRPALDHTSRDPLPGMLVDAVAELEGALFDAQCDLPRLWCLIDQAGFYVDGWERLIISTQQVTTDLPADT
jgi:hypothetical protein